MCSFENVNKRYVPDIALYGEAFCHRKLELPTPPAGKSGAGTGIEQSFSAHIVLCPDVGVHNAKPWAVGMVYKSTFRLLMDARHSKIMATKRHSSCAAWYYIDRYRLENLNQARAARLLCGQRLALCSLSPHDSAGGVTFSNPAEPRAPITAFSGTIACFPIFGDCSFMALTKRFAR